MWTGLQNFSKFDLIPNEDGFEVYLSLVSVLVCNEMVNKVNLWLSACLYLSLSQSISYIYIYIYMCVCVCVCVCIYIIIIIMSYCHLGFSWLSFFFSLSPFVLIIHRSRQVLLTTSSVCTKLIKFFLVSRYWCVHRRTWVFQMGGNWLFSCYFERCCFQDLFKASRSILVLFPSSPFSMRFDCVHVVHLYSSINIATAYFIG